MTDAQQPAACPHRERCECIGTCKHGMAGSGATEIAAAQQPEAVDGVEQLTEQQAVIVTGYTGTLCGSFGAFHADLENRAGRSVFTHEMSDFGWIKSLYRDDFIALAGQHGGPTDDR